MREFTPLTEEVRLTFARLAPPRTNPLAEFDRWLAQHDAEVRKQVAEEIAEALKRHADAVRAREIGGAS